MRQKKAQLHDPRTVARDVAGIFETVFPQMIPAVCAYLNRERSFSVDDCTPVSFHAVRLSSLQPAMLFELAIAIAERRIQGRDYVDWEESLRIACLRQRRFFDAKLPDTLTTHDRELAWLVSSNLARMLSAVSRKRQEPILVRPHLPGYAWIANGNGDFGTQSSIVEVKCTRRRFSTADYRQVVFYWLLSSVAALETGAPHWKSGLLLNPRLNIGVDFDFDEVLALISHKRSFVAVVERFRYIVGEDLDLRDGEFATH